MKTTSSFVLFVFAMVAAAIGLTTLASEQADEAGASIYLSEIPQGYREWQLIAVSRLTKGNESSQLRAQLGNEIAIKAYQEGKLPFPDGAIFAALHWNEVSSEDNNKVLAKGFPGACHSNSSAIDRFISRSDGASPTGESGESNIKTANEPSFMWQGG